MVIPIAISLPSSEIPGGSNNSQWQDMKVPRVNFTRIFIIHEIIHVRRMVIIFYTGGLDAVSKRNIEVLGGSPSK